METHRLKSVLLAPKIMNGSASSRNAINSATDAAFMDRALELAARGIALASPNPLVGAVLVRDGRVIGEGFHTYEGVRHAEIIALDAAGEAARGATLYINLEPCCHTGRTGPCTQALIAAGVARVVAAMPDPNPQVAGRGFQQLRAAGIEVSVGLPRSRSAAPERSFRSLDRFPQTPRDAKIRAHARWPACSSQTRNEVLAPLPAEARAFRKTTAGFPRPNRAPKCSACATPPTPCSPASARC